MNRDTRLLRVIFILISTMLFLADSLSAQTYTTALGLRWGDGIGVSARQRLLKRTSAEGIFYQHHKSDQTVAGLMLAHHMPVLTKRLNLYIGGGAGWIFPEASESGSSQYKAVLGSAGLEFTIARLNMSWDFVPVIPIQSAESQMTTMTAFSLRYVVIKKPKQGLFQKDNKKHKRKKSQKRHHRKK